MASFHEPGNQTYRVYKLSEIEGKKKEFCRLGQFFLIVLGEFQMQPIEATGISTFAGNIKDVALPLAELQLYWRNKSLMQ